MLLSCVQLFCNPLDYSLPDSSVNVIFQARILEWIVISFPGFIPSQGLDSHLLHWQVDSLPLSHLGSHVDKILKVTLRATFIDHGFMLHKSWIFIRRIDGEAETSIILSPDLKNWLMGKDPDVGKEWRQEEKGMTEDEMVGCHHKLWELMKDREAWCAAVHWVTNRHDRVTELNWTESVSLVVLHYLQSTN